MTVKTISGAVEVDQHHYSSESGAMKSAEAVADGQAPDSASKKGGFADTTRFLLLLFLIVLVLRIFISPPFMNPSGSMQRPMMLGDYLFVAKWPYGYSRYSFPFGLASFVGSFLAGAPERGDILVFR